MVGEYFGPLGNFEYNIGDKLYEFATMNYEDFDKLKVMYIILILILHMALFLDTGETCKEIETLNKRKEKVENSAILQEYNREYKRIHGLHYKHTKEFKEKKFKEWSKKARLLRDSCTDEQIKDFKSQLKSLSDLFLKG